MNSSKLLAVATAGFVLLGCSETTAVKSVPVESVAETETVVETTAPVAQPVIGMETGMRPQQLINVPSLLSEGRRAEALDLASDVIQPLSTPEQNALIDTYFDRESALKNNQIAIVVAEAIARQNPKNAKAHYISGLAYFQGITVDKDAGMMERYWSADVLKSNKVVQGRLADVYADSTSPVYDPAKADAARALSR